MKESRRMTGYKYLSRMVHALLWERPMRRIDGAAGGTPSISLTTDYWTIMLHAVATSVPLLYSFTAVPLLASENIPEPTEWAPLLHNFRPTIAYFFWIHSLTSLWHHFSLLPRFLQPSFLMIQQILISDRSLLAKKKKTL